MLGVWHFHTETAILKYIISLHSYMLYNTSRYFKKRIYLNKEIYSVQLLLSTPINSLVHSFLCVVVGFSPVKYIPFIATRILYSLMDSIWMRSPSITLSYPASLIIEISGVLTRFAKSPTLILHCE
jgi:hypothetical protein